MPPSGFSLRYSADPSQVGVWTHLVSSYDLIAHKMSLYVNGKLDRTTDVTLTNASGPFVVGAGQSGGARVDQLPGAIDHVQVWDRTLSAAEAAKHANLAVLRARYDFDELTGTTTKDEVSGQQGTLSGDVAWASTPLDPDDPNQILTGRDKWLRFADSRTGAMTGPRPANLRTDRSYTVSVWVRNHGLGETALSLGAGSPFVLGYLPESDRWAVQLKDTPSGTGVQVLSDEPAAANEWMHLVATFDATTGTITLYVRGVKQFATVTGVQTFNGTGDLSVGNGWVGDIDDARVYSGAFSAQEVGDLYSSTSHL